MSQQRSITVKQLYGGKVWEIRGCTHPHKDLLQSLSCEWEAKKLRWLWHGKDLPTALQQLADGTYGLEGLKTGVLDVEPTSTPKSAVKPIAPKREQTEPQNSDAPKSDENRKFKIGDRVMTTLGRTGGIVQGYHENLVVVKYPQYGPVTNIISETVIVLNADIFWQSTRTTLFMQLQNKAQSEIPVVFCMLGGRVM